MSILAFADIQFGYSSETHLRLSGSRIDLESGSALGLIGGNGTGKTTLLRILAGVLDGHTGTLEISRGSSRLLIPADLTQLLLPWYSVRKNIALLAAARLRLPEKSQTDAEARLAFLLDDARATALMRRPTWGISTGQRAVIALTAALLRGPDILLLDEIFANTSLKTGTRIAQSLKEYCAKGGILVFTSHRPDVVARLATKILDLEAA